MTVSTSAPPGAARTSARRLHSTRRSRRRTAAIAIAQVAVVLAFLIPIIWMYVASFRPDGDIQTGRLWPHAWTLRNYRQLLSEPTLARGFVNSVVVSSTSAAIATSAAALAAYGLARYRFRGRATVTLGLIVAQVVPALTLLVPLVVALQKMHLTDNLIGLTTVYLLLGVPIGVMLLRNYVTQIPDSLEEAAFIDGATRIKALWYITLPLLRPALAAVFAFAFILAWGEYLLALSLQTSDDEKTLPLVMQTLFDQHTFSIGEVTAFGVLISLPVAVLFMVVQKSLVANLVAGGVK
ncbi:MAG TPA: carbohydrate ABC transporter permease [Jatrophihabitantaceae bacterium]|jgi:ABC-type glycerol-3-phosphate transport system permease component